MAELDQETHRMIVETHTMMQVLVKNHDEHKLITNARIKEANKRLEDHKKEVKETFETHLTAIDAGKAFRTKVVTYASVAAGFGAFFMEPILNLIKKAFGA